MTAHFQFFMILGAAILLLIIFALLKKGQMSVKYSLLWLALAVVLVIFAVFPYVVYVLRDLLDVQMPVNLVFMLMFCFVLLVLLSLSIGVSSLRISASVLPRKTPSWKSACGIWRKNSAANNPAKGV